MTRELKLRIAAVALGSLGAGLAAFGLWNGPFEVAGLPGRLVLLAVVIPSLGVGIACDREAKKARAEREAQVRA